MPWHALYCESQRELWARDKLREREFTVFCPYTVYKRHRDTAKGRVVYDLPQAIYPNYLFIDTDDYLAATKVPGVLTVVSVRGNPLRMPAFVIQRLMAVCGKDGLVEHRDITKPSYWFAGVEGDEFEFAPESPLYGLLGQISSLRLIDEDGACLQAWVNMFGRRHEVDVPVEHVAKLVKAEQAKIAA